MVLDAILVDRLTNLAAMDVRKKFFPPHAADGAGELRRSQDARADGRFTADMDSLHGGVQTLLGRAVREPLKMLACFVGAGPSSAGGC